ncbi:cell differentiation family, Rcd1-like-domain-containing protein [Truncatella angustata]|uniref:Cell differentiation family, Rcd1-like-domain-containing protein n=1 Tax=Truncatella angustata TaxID=152316 RepID=A0A9P8UDI1_9PEZI|nr:cell differentiation family, Rcd1-like-domain-containing protein [Truncatella angustata]KAH6647649.1 cell differentiation family, Rcd1-like-domain-containing protein [Truncatella angustata]
MAMFPNPNMYSNHNYEPQGAAWMHPQQQQQQQQGNHHSQQHVQQQAIAAAAAAQHQNYNRIAGAHNNVAGAGLNSAVQLHDNNNNNSSNNSNNNNTNNNNTNTNSNGNNIESNVSEDNRRTLAYVADLLKESTREAALLELSKKREQVPELALILWHSFGVMTCLTQEIISVYTLLNPSQLTAAASNRVCNALALLQCVASHNETRTLFLKAHIPLYLYPFLNTTSKSRPFEYLRLTSLGVIGALVKNDSTEVINFLLTTEIIPLCLRIMETGSELSKTVAIFIVQKILLDDSGLNYICATYERFYAVGTVLSNMVGQLVEQQTARLLKHVVRCFLRLSDNARAREALRQCLPEPLRDATFSAVLRDDAATKRCLAQLLLNLSDSMGREVDVPGL